MSALKKVAQKILQNNMPFAKILFVFTKPIFVFQKICVVQIGFLKLSTTKPAFTAFTAAMEMETTHENAVFGRWCTGLGLY